MVAFNFQKQFADDVESGKKKRTIRKHGKRRPPVPGNELQLYTGMRTKVCRLLRRAICTRVTKVLIDPKLLQVLTYNDPEGRFQRLKDSELEAFALADGFSNVESFLHFFESNLDPEDVCFYGYMIEWES